MQLEFVDAPLAELAGVFAVPELNRRQTVIPGVSYTCIDAYRPPAVFANPFVRANSVSEVAFDTFERTQSIDVSFLGGITSIDVPWVVGAFGALVQPLTRTAPVSFPTNADRPFARADLESFPDIGPAFPDRTNLERPARFTFDRCKIEKIASGILVAQPGMFTFGHWLLDMISRLNVLRHMLMTRQFKDMPVYHFGMPEFGHQFLELLGLANVRFVELHPSVIYELDELHEPAPIKIGHWVNLDQLAQSLHSFRLAASAYADRRPTGDDPRLNARPEKIYFSRERWALGDQTRRFANRKEMGALLERLGFTAIQAEEYSVAELTILLRSAKIVVGEDGSALHNVIFARNSCALVVVLSDQRMNMWHGSFCSAMGHRVAFIRSLPGDGSGQIVPLQDLEETIKAVQKI
jgi:hypothetical protein